MNAREILFNIPKNHHRFTGNPYRKKITSKNELDRFITINSGINPCFCSKFSFNGNPNINSSFLETDSNDLKQTLIETKKGYNWFINNDIDCIILFSGKKGFHLHPLLQEYTYDNPSGVLSNFANLMLSETKAKDFDPVVLSDTQRLVRIPNTLRPEGLWCIPLDPYDFPNITIEEVLELAQTPQNVNYKFEKPRHKHINFVEETKKVEKVWIPPSPKDFGILEHILRPCIYKNIVGPNPSEIVRSSAAIELLNFGLNSTKITDLFQTLNWIDFKRSYTLMRIDFIIKRREMGDLRHPHGKEKLGCTKKCTCLECFKGEQ